MMGMRAASVLECGPEAKSAGVSIPYPPDEQNRKEIGEIERTRAHKSTLGSD